MSKDDYTAQAGKEFQELAEPLMDWLAERYNDPIQVIVTANSARFAMPLLTINRRPEQEANAEEVQETRPEETVPESSDRG